MPQLAIAALIGAVSGMVAALCGVGGGVLMVPAFAFFLGFAQKEAVATSLGAVILIAIFGTMKNHANELVNWPVAITAALVGATVAWFGADLLKQFSNETLTRIFAVLLILVGIRMLWPK
jgi:uncharacterized protein